MRLCLVGSDAVVAVVNENCDLVVDAVAGGLDDDDDDDDDDDGRVPTRSQTSWVNFETSLSSGTAMRRDTRKSCSCAAGNGMASTIEVE